MIPGSAIEAAMLRIGPAVTIRDIITILEAAAPHMLAEAWDEGYDAADYDAPHSIKRPNPYRSQA